jgi:hypothetical protein
VGISVIATYATEHSQNNYPALPVRDDADVFVWMTIFRDEADRARRVAELEQSSAWRESDRARACAAPGRASPSAQAEADLTLTHPRLIER